MATADPLDILLPFDRWATHQILDACATLPDEQFHRKFEMGPGSLHNTLVHMVAAMRVWTDVLARREVRPRLEGQTFAVADLKKLHDETATEFAAQVRAEPLDQLVKRVRNDKTYMFPRGGVAMQVMTHGPHHRAQCLNMLRHLGVAKLPPSSVAEWLVVTGGAQQS